MKYFIQRELNEYGPYTLADLQRYVAQGNIQLTDMTRSEGMTEWVPVSQVLGNIPAVGIPPVPQAAMPAAGMGQAATAGTVYGGPAAAPGSGTVYSGTGAVYEGQMQYGAQAMSMPLNTPVPTDFHWALVLLITVCTCGLFGWAWLFVQTAFAKKIKPESKALMFGIIALCVAFIGGAINGYMNATTGIRTNNPIFSLGGLVLVEIALFQMKSDLEDYYNRVEPINLQLNGVAVFFLGIFYFQHHLSRIAQWKKTGVLQP